MGVANILTVAGEDAVGGTIFGRYRLIELLGRGGMGEVWRGHDTTIDRMVALKVLLAHFAKDRTFEQRFRREARAAARLDDPHVVPIYDVGELEGRLYVTMRLIKGRDLQAIIDDGPLKPERAVRLTDQVAAALHAAHQTGLVHRDVKPANILVTDNDFAYLIDFGIAHAAEDTKLTSTGFTIGTWSYMAPERFGEGEVGPSSDIYALTCVLYQCLTGQLPFPGTTFEQVAMAHLNKPPPKPSARRREIPVAMDHVIATGLAKDPDRRYQTALALAASAKSAVNEPKSADSAETIDAEITDDDEGVDKDWLFEEELDRRRRAEAQEKLTSARGKDERRSKRLSESLASWLTGKTANTVWALFALVVFGTLIATMFHKYESSSPTPPSASQTATSTSESLAPAPTLPSPAPAPAPTTSTSTITMPSTYPEPSETAVSGSTCSDKGKLANAAGTGRELYCATFSQSHWIWTETPAGLTGLHVTNTSCDPGVEIMSRSPDGYMVSCQPSYSAGGAPMGVGTWQHFDGMLE